MTTATRTAPRCTPRPRKSTAATTAPARTAAASIRSTKAARGCRSSSAGRAEFKPGKSHAMVNQIDFIASFADAAGHRTRRRPGDRQPQHPAGPAGQGREGTALHDRGSRRRSPCDAARGSTSPATGNKLAPSTTSIPTSANRTTSQNRTSPWLKRCAIYWEG